MNDLNEVLPIQGTLTKCLELGEYIRTNIDGQKDPDLRGMFELLDKKDYKPKMLLEGNLNSARTSVVGGFDSGIIELSGVWRAIDDKMEIKKERETMRKFTIIFQNESLLLWSDGASCPCVVAPDLISYIICGTTPQRIYSNGDIMDSSGKLLTEFVGADIKVICMEAPMELKEHAENVKNLQNKALGTEATLHDSYRSMLEELNYYGDGESSFKDV